MKPVWRNGPEVGFLTQPWSQKGKLAVVAMKGGNRGIQVEEISYAQVQRPERKGARSGFKTEQVFQLVTTTLDPMEKTVPSPGNNSVPLHLTPIFVLSHHCRDK